MIHKVYKIILIIPALSGLYIFYNPAKFVFFGKLGFLLLLFILFIRLLSNIFSKSKLLKNLVVLRKEIGIVCGVFILAHVVGYFLAYNISVFTYLKNSNFWNFDNFLFWGTIGFLAMIPVLFTSNLWSMKKLKKWWKPVQRLTYIFFLGGVLHIVLIDSTKIPVFLFFIFVFIIMRIFIYRRSKKTLIEILFLLFLFLIILVKSFKENKTDLKKISDKNFDKKIILDDDDDDDDVQKNIDKELKISNKCVGCGKCAMVASETFIMNTENFRAEIILQPETQTEKITQAIEICPVRAISFE